MRTLFNLVILAIATIAGYKRTIASQKERITELEGQVATAGEDDAAREERAQKAEARAAELEAVESEANDKAAELAAALEAEPTVPTVNPDTFVVTEGPTAQPSDLELRERNAETAGNPVEADPVVVPNQGSANNDQ